MSGDLERYVGGGVAVPYVDRKATKQARRIYDNVRLGAFEATSEAKLAAHLVDKATELLDHQRELVKDDPAKEMATAPFIQIALARLVEVQMRDRNSWRL